MDNNFVMVTKRILENGKEAFESSADNGQERWVLIYSLIDNHVEHYCTDKKVVSINTIEEFFTEEGLIAKCAELGLTYIG